jgi:acetylornithine deacetylase/succinyl-diaminopimelate desuccinylase-like protein
MIDPARIRDVLDEMIRIDSSLPNERMFAEFIAGEVRAFGLDAELTDVSPGRPNVTARLDCGGDGFLVFSGHSDTVHPATGWQTDPFEPVEHDGKLLGLGVINMKAGLAVMLEALRDLSSSSELQTRLGSVGFAVTVDQEGLSTGARALLDTAYGRCDGMLHAEHFHGSSSRDYLPAAGMGKVLYRITVSGEAGHAFRPEEGGVNAIDDAARIVRALERLSLGEDPLLGRGTLSVLRIDGGEKEYSVVIPERCEIIATRLTVPGESSDSAVSELRGLVDALGLDSRVEIDTPPPFYQPYALDRGSAVSVAFESAFDHVFGGPPVYAGHRGVTDANVFAGEAGIPTVVFGPRGGLHHRPGEYVELATLEPSANVYVETALAFFENGRAGGDGIRD